MLARREHSRQELQYKLIARGFSSDAVTRVIEQLSDAGLQSDARYTEAYVNERTNSGYGPLYISRALRSRGIDAPLIARFLDPNDPDWTRRAAALLDKRFGSIAEADSKTRARAMRFLQQRGFSAEQVRRILSDNIDDY